jgi:zinc protease
MRLRFRKHDLLAVALGALISQLAAQEALPQAGAILDKYIEATGGRAAYEKLHSEVRSGSMELVGKGITFKMTLYRAAPSKSYMVLEVPGVGQMEEGTDGQVAWSRSAVQGPRVKEGDERALALLAAAFNADLRWRDLYKSAETQGSEEVNGQSCYKVLITTKEGLQQTRYYDKKSGLLVKAAMIAKTQMGEIPTESLLSDYKSVDGILIPHKTFMKVLGQEIVMTLDSLKTNVEIEESRFQAPEEIKALLGKSPAKESKP